MSIPGLSVRVVNENEGAGVKISTFGGTQVIPASHIHGNCRFVEEFVKLEILHDGSSGVIYKCQERSKEEISALKKFKLDPKAMEDDKCRERNKERICVLKKFRLHYKAMEDGIPSKILREINILCNLQHENIIKAYGVIASKKIESNFLHLEYCVLSLNDLMQKKIEAIYERDVVKYIMHKLFQGLRYIHEALIMHRSICCRNLLFTDCGTLKISGFQEARFYSPNEEILAPVNEITYRAPELLLRSKVLKTSADIWAVGCVFAKLLLKRPLFPGNTEIEVFNSILGVLGTPSEELWKDMNKTLAKMELPERIITESLPYSEMKTILAGAPESSIELVEDLLLYCPSARPQTSEVLRKSPYFIDSAPECTANKMSSIIKSVLPPETSVEQMDI